MAEVAFGIFDHIERRDAPLGELYEGRLRFSRRPTGRLLLLPPRRASRHAARDGPVAGNLFLAAAVQRTRRIHLGPLVYLLPLYHPIRLAEEICMLDQLSGGRFEVGVGRGVSPLSLRTST